LVDLIRLPKPFPMSPRTQQGYKNL